MANGQTVTVKILDREYQVSCKPEEVADLRRSAGYLDEKMREIKGNASVLGLDRIAVMAALNIANDLLAQSQKTDDVVASQAAEIKTLNAKLDHALSRIKATVQ